jgi:hypothetical protein
MFSLVPTGEVPIGDVTGKRARSQKGRFFSSKRGQSEGANEGSRSVLKKVAWSISHLLARHAQERADELFVSSDPMDYRRAVGRAVDVCIVMDHGSPPSVSVLSAETPQGRMVGIPESNAVAWFSESSQSATEEDLLIEAEKISSYLLRRLGKESRPTQPMQSAHPVDAPRTHSMFMQVRCPRVVGFLTARGRKALGAWQQRSQTTRVAPA